LFLARVPAADGDDDGENPKSSDGCSDENANINRLLVVVIHAIVIFTGIESSGIFFWTCAYSITTA